MPENGNISFVVMCMRKENMYQNFFSPVSKEYWNEKLNVEQSN